MKFGTIPIAEALGAILAHSLRADARTIKKGRILDRTDLSALSAAGHEAIMAARLEPSDVGEDDAARALAAASAGEHVVSSRASNGRSNLIARSRGLAILDRAQVAQVNAVDEGLTVATLEPFTVVEPGDLLATVKVIPFSISESTLADCLRHAVDPGALVRVAAFRSKRVSLLQTELPGFKKSLIDKMLAVTTERIEGLGGELIDARVCEHDEAAVAEALKFSTSDNCEILLILGASAIVDRRDTVPAAIVRAGGEVRHLGMPVDPGNLMLLGILGKTVVLGLPGSARSPRLHGFDWVLQRLFAGLEVSGTDLTQMAVGGLLKDIPGRPMPRRIAAPMGRPRRETRIAALVFAAGQSRRMGRTNKLLAKIDGVAMVRRVVDAVTASNAQPVLVVTGHQSGRVRDALKECSIEFVDNPDFGEGISSSLRHGLAALPEDIDAVLICLGDMPRVSASILNRLIDAFDPEDADTICVPVHRGKRGNPVLWTRRYFHEMREIAGDVGAKHLIGKYSEALREVEMSEEGVLIDVDSPDALAALKPGSKKSA
ncbi:MAG: molybdopterin-binding/glycosyltransferase family 2 protein [Alphaproteobacteria bacterium]|nr:molybdopterin-binding/glycosyltransferase family 2 protein [Alphaproteobacteria bacterium]